MVTALLLSAALFSWPDQSTTTRLRALAPTRRARPRRPPRPGTITLTCAAAGAGWLVAAVPGAAAAALATATCQRRWRTRTDQRQALTTTDALAEAIRSLVAGLRTGAHPAEAAESAALDAHPSAAGPMRAIAAAARLNGDIHRALAAAHTHAAPTLAKLSRAWALAQRHGLPLADVLETTGRDLDQRTRFTRQVMARMAGPRASATVLSLLPALGVTLGEAMGAHPLRVLTTTTRGQVLLLLGVTLLCAGSAWCARLTSQAAPS